MTKKAITERRQRNADLTKTDRQNRCKACLREHGPIRWSALNGDECCSQECRDGHNEWLEYRRNGSTC